MSLHHVTDSTSLTYTAVFASVRVRGRVPGPANTRPANTRPETPERPRCPGVPALAGVCWRAGAGPSGSAEARLAPCAARRLYRGVWQ
jgi:hypothetical protein